jgi:hypothetical protein
LEAEEQSRKGEFMSNENSSRVLTRMGARKLSQAELDEIYGGLIPTRLTMLVTGSSSNPDHSFDT